MSLSLGVAKEGAILAGVAMFSDELEEILSELKLGGKLFQELVHAVQKLDEYRASLVIWISFIEVSKSSLELVTEREPVFVNQHLETLHRPVVGVQH